ncbi:MFS transporter [Candidatus Tisiphia endosymbiont of Nemotelus uliginosus]|uniref:MFS transporter n=1 Tax=Candidatus Tisiphia endosymbiont of Nemotelus uliginosus TaxID=3077926 RepID=UPI0035C8E2AA
MQGYAINNTGTFASLTKQQKQSIGLLSIGTFLEYFDLMLYVHMAVFLNELFFPKTDSHTAALYSAAAFCSTYVLRPFGALIFGWIGDHIGRKVTVVITTFMMAISCIIMANLPTYEQIGITAAWLVTLCRIIQGISSMGEVIGAKIYLTEITTPPVQYFVVTLISVFYVIGSTAALGIASLVLSFGLNWRIAFWIGAVIAIIGTVARTVLREVPEFADAQRQIKKKFKRAKINIKLLKDDPIYTEKTNKLTVISLFFISCGWPVWFYFVYIHCAQILKTTFNYSAEQVIHHNFIISIINLLGYFVLSYLSYIIYPLKILKIKLLILFPVTLMTPYLLTHINTPLQLLLLQSFFMLVVLSGNSAEPIFYKYFPIFKRFTYVSFLFAFAHSLMQVIIAFGTAYLTKHFGQWGLVLFIMMPVMIGFSFGIYHFQQLEQGAAT